MHLNRRVRFFSTVDLVNALEQEKSSGRQGQIANRLLYADLVILDELGYLPLAKPVGHCCFTCSQSCTKNQRDTDHQLELLGMEPSVWR